MQPVEPGLVCGRGWDEVVYAKDQPEYLPLPSLKCQDGRVISRWQLSAEERKLIAEGADIFLTLHTFNMPLQPIRMNVGAFGVDTSDVEVRRESSTTDEQLKAAKAALLSKAG